MKIVTVSIKMTMEDKSISEKLDNLRCKYGLAGWGLYFGLKEMLMKRHTKTSPFDLEFLTTELKHENRDFIESVIKDFGLFRFEINSRNEVFFMLIQAKRKRGGQLGNTNACKRTNKNKLEYINIYNTDNYKTNTDKCYNNLEIVKNETEYVNNCITDNYKTNTDKTIFNIGNENKCVNSCNTDIYKTNTQQKKSETKKKKKSPLKIYLNTPQEKKENTLPNARTRAHARNENTNSKNRKRMNEKLQAAQNNSEAQNKVPPQDFYFDEKQDLENRAKIENYANKLLTDDFRLESIASQFSLANVEEVKKYSCKYKSWAQVSSVNLVNYGAFCKQFMTWLRFEIKPNYSKDYGKYKSKAAERRADVDIENITIEEYEAGF